MIKVTMFFFVVLLLTFYYDVDYVPKIYKYKYLEELYIEKNIVFYFYNARGCISSLFAAALSKATALAKLWLLYYKFCIHVIYHFLANCVKKPGWSRF